MSARRDGFTLVEVIMATTLLAVVMIMLATLATSISQRGRRNDLVTKRTLVLSQQVGRLQAMPFADVTQVTSGTTQMLVGDFTFKRRFAVTQATADRRIIRVVIEPLAGEFLPDSATVDRTRPASGTPLCTNC